MQPNPYAQYKQMEVTTTDPLKLVVMLYDGAITALRRSIEHIEAKDFNAKHKELMRAHDIIFELMACLDKEKGGEVAKNLQALYSYMINRLMLANANLDTSIIEEVMTLLRNLNDGWRELAKSRGIDTSAEGLQATRKASPAPSRDATAAMVTLSGKEKVL